MSIAQINDLCKGPLGLLGAAFGGEEIIEDCKKISDTMNIVNIVGIIAFLNIPIIFASVNFWAAEIQSHPQMGMSKQPSGILAPFLFSSKANFLK